MADVFRKLDLRDRAEALVLQAPGSFEVEIEQLAGVTVHREVRDGHPIDFVLVFVTERSEVERFAATLAGRLTVDPICWFAYPKRSSKRYASGLSRDVGWGPLGEHGFEPVKQVAIDEDWSALRFRRVDHIRRLSRDPGMTLSEEGRKRATRFRNG